VRVATWNVNSVRSRLPRLLEWLEQRRPDVVCLQETKATEAEFPRDEVGALGYEVAHHGTGRWNGVALLSRVGLEDVRRGFDSAPPFDGIDEPRAISATCAGVRVWSLYVPNGRDPADPHYAYKLEWLRALTPVVAGDINRFASGGVIVAGDFNIAPTDADVFDVKAFEGLTHVTPPEREALAALRAGVLADVVRDVWPDERVFSYWDYRAGMFHKDLGMRIDLVLASPPVSGRVKAAWVDRQARKGTGPSDHAPVMVDLDDAPDGAIGPVVPPPSLGRKR
jgi:exodeoxyribonuclease-3